MVAVKLRLELGPLINSQLKLKLTTYNIFVELKKTYLYAN